MVLFIWLISITAWKKKYLKYDNSASILHLLIASTFFFFAALLFF